MHKLNVFTHLKLMEAVLYASYENRYVPNESDNMLFKLVPLLSSKFQFYTLDS